MPKFTIYAPRLQNGAYKWRFCVFNSEKKKTKLNYEKRFKVGFSLRSKHSITHTLFHISPRAKDRRCREWCGEAFLYSPHHSLLRRLICSDYNFARGQNNRCSRKEAVTFFSGTNVDWTRVSGGNRAWARMRKKHLSGTLATRAKGSSTFLNWKLSK